MKTLIEFLERAIDELSLNIPGEDTPESKRLSAVRHHLKQALFFARLPD